MNSKRQKETLSERVTVRFTPTQLSIIRSKANELGMTHTAYIQDKSVNGRERMNNTKRKLIIATINAQKHLDQLYELLDSTQSNNIPKETIYNFLNNARKEINYL